MKQAIENIRNYTFEEAKRDYEEVKKTVNPRIHDVHLTLSRDGKPFLKRYSDVSHAPQMASQQPWIEDDAEWAFENAKRDLIDQVESELLHMED